MEKLIKGLHAFKTEVFLNQKELFERLAGGQNPDALFITCSDSRVSPNLITQTSPGDLFILRNAGNIIPPYGASSSGEAATIEFAVAGLNVRDIIVCGHSFCGAMRALLHPELAEGLPALKSWLNHAAATKRIMDENYEVMDDERALNVAIQENVLVQLENLRTHPTVAARMSRGDLNLHGWVYKIQAGEVFGYQPEQGQFLSIAEVPNTGIGGRSRLPEAASI